MHAETLPRSSGYTLPTPLKITHMQCARKMNHTPQLPPRQLVLGNSPQASKSSCINLSFIYNVQRHHLAGVL